MARVQALKHVAMPGYWPPHHRSSCDEGRDAPHWETCQLRNHDPEDKVAEVDKYSVGLRKVVGGRWLSSDLQRQYWLLRYLDMHAIRPYCILYER